MEVRNLSSIGIQQTFRASEAQNTNLLKQDAPVDTAEFSKEKKELTKEDKQEIARKARTTAAGWATFGGIFSTLYYAFRSDEKVAKKYDLDPEKDKAFIRDIKSAQVKWTLPGILGPELGVVGWIYNKVRNPNKIDV